MQFLQFPWLLHYVSTCESIIIHFLSISVNIFFFLLSIDYWLKRWTCNDDFYKRFKTLPTHLYLVIVYNYPRRPTTILWRRGLPCLLSLIFFFFRFHYLENDRMKYISNCTKQSVIWNKILLNVWRLPA